MKKTLSDFNLSTKMGRYRARQHGFDVPKLKNIYEYFGKSVFLFGSKDPNTGCWNFSGKLNPDGYGVFYVGGKKIAAHRAAYQESHGLIPTGHCVCHRCDNTRCINPDHLFSGTQGDNVADKVLKGRQAKGENARTAKLTKEKVVEIRALRLKNVPVPDIARRYRMSIRGTYSIILRESWKHV